MRRRPRRPATCSSSTSAARALGRAELLRAAAGSSIRDGGAACAARSARARLLPDRRQRRGHRGDPAGRRLRQARRSTASRTGPRSPSAYAAALPGPRRGLVLDSVVLPDGPDPFDRSTLAARAARLRELCAGSDCAGVTADPRGDARRPRLAAERSHACGHGRQRPRRASSMLDGRSRPPARPARAATSTRRCAPSSPARCAARCTATRADPAPPSAGELNDDQRPPGRRAAPTALFVTTVCEEARVPVEPQRRPRRRAPHAAVARPRAIPRPTRAVRPPSRCSPTSIPLCARWPNASAAPAPVGPLPQVPTLVIDGEADLRTPVEDARRSRPQIPGATFVEVPFIGHSVLGSDLTGCARAARRPRSSPASSPAPCAPTQNLFSPDAGRADAARAGARRKPQRRKTVNAAAETLNDVAAPLPRRRRRGAAAPRSGSRIGGLRAGYAALDGDGIRLRASVRPGRHASRGLAHAAATGRRRP